MPNLGETISDVKDSSEASSPSMDAMADSSTDKTSNESDVKEGQSLGDFLKERNILDGDGNADSSEGSEAETEGSKKSISVTEIDKESAKEKDGKKVSDKEDVANEEKDKEKEDDTEVDETKPVPYDRFKQVNDERNNLKTEVEGYKSKATNFDAITDYCTKNNIQPTEFQKALEIQSMLSRGDAEGALKALRPILESLESLNGDRLPPDLQSKVDDAKMELEDAKELARLRNRGKLDTKSMERQRADWQRQQEAEYANRCRKAANDWELGKRGSDPDYLPKKNENSPDGKWELTRDKYLALSHATNERGEYFNPIRSESDMLALMDKAYKSVTAIWSTIKRPPTRKSLSSNGSSTHSQKPRIEDAPTMADAIKIAVAGRL